MSDVVKIVALPGDGPGPELIEQGIELLNAMREPLGIQFSVETVPFDSALFRYTGELLPASTLEKCRHADAVLLGPAGDPGASGNQESLSARVLKEMRNGLDVYCNIRNIRRYNVLPANAPAFSTGGNNIDFVLVQELKNGFYFQESMKAKNGDPWQEKSPEKSHVQRVTRKAFRLARLRKQKITMVDDTQANSESQLWKDAFLETAREFPAVKLETLPIDQCLQELSKNPFRFDVLLSANVFSDDMNRIADELTDASGMLASACLGDTVSIYQPVHILDGRPAKTNSVSPVAVLNSIALMLCYTFQRPLIAQNVEDAISTVLTRGFHTSDSSVKDGQLVNTKEMGQYIREEMLHHLSGPFMTA